ncbi:hypothetical protein [Desulfuromonas acetoxidans]|uniref:hypothetical protein n=1 Tax=Desulfuromonas acetoxidans TaxID=891 RepID=UPI00293086C0|nr:hypothetical protein [Desulfuromonas acetoxidans]
MKTWIIVLLIVLPSIVSAAHLRYEREYQAQWCSAVGGETEYRLQDGTRVDCLTDDYAIEFDFASKWAESIGQSLYYGICTERLPGVVLILEKESDSRYLPRIKAVANLHGIKVWTTGPCATGEGHEQ